MQVTRTDSGAEGHGPGLTANFRRELIFMALTISGPQSAPYDDLLPRDGLVRVQDPTFEIANNSIGLEPIGSPKWTVAGKIWTRWQITALNI